MEDEQLTGIGLQTEKENGPLLRRWWRSACSYAHRLVRPTGCFIVLVGPDGCGKSTVTTELLAQLEPRFRGCLRFHWRPGLLPKLGRKGDGGLAIGGQSPPTGESRYRGIVSLARFFYYSTDFVVGYWLLLYPRRVQATAIVGERYFTDVVVNPLRYGFAVPASLLRAMSFLIPKPDLTVLLSNDPEVIRLRKPELSADEIREQLARFAVELPRWGQTITVRTDTQPAEVASRIVAHVLSVSRKRDAGPVGRWSR